MQIIDNHTGTLLARVQLVLGTLAIAGLCAVGLAFGAGRLQPDIHIPYGITDTQLTADGVHGVLVRARRENFNAHGFDVLSIYARTKSNAEPDAAFLIVPVWEGETERLELTSGGGADCKLSGFRVIGVGAGRDVQIVAAKREFGTSYADVADVTFTYFTLKRNSDGEAGRPPYYFESTASVKAKKQYCDVDDAFTQELGFRSK